jgi:hypothetical protein
MTLNAVLGLFTSQSILNRPPIEALYEASTDGELEDRVAYRPSFLPCGKAGGFQIRRCQKLAVAHYGGTLGGLALKPAGFCNVGGIFHHFNPNVDGLVKSVEFRPSGEGRSLQAVEITGSRLSPG